MRRTGVWVSLFRNFIIHHIFSEFLQPLRDFRTQRVTPFYHGLLFMGLWVFLVGLATLLVIGFTATTGLPALSSTLELDTCTGEVSLSVWSSLSSLTVTWCSWWRRRARRRCRMMPPLSWRCHWGWRVKTGGRTRWQAWNHGKNEVLRVALHPNHVLNEMWFLTVDPLIRISVFIAKLSER